MDAKVWEGFVTNYRSLPRDEKVEALRDLTLEQRAYLANWLEDPNLGLRKDPRRLGILLWNDLDSEVPGKLCSKDFSPRRTESPGFLKSARYQSFEEVLREANRWLLEHSIEPISIETVVLPNIYDWSEQGSQDTSLQTDGEQSSQWHQVVRVWYQTPRAGN